MRRFILIGKPLGHSLSPALFRHWFDRHDLDADYQARETEEKEIDGLLAELAAGDLEGANVTIPYKQQICGKLAKLDSAARAIGAVNTLVRDGKSILGLNTDAPAFVKCLEEARDPNSPPIKAGCVFGSGGAARAVVSALLQRGMADIRVVGRNPAAGRSFRALGGAVGWFSWEQAAVAAEGAGLLVNATPLGQAGFPAFPKIALKALPDGAALDLVYNPRRTSFQELTETMGFKTANGFSMLVIQAALAFKGWFGFLPDRSGITQDSLTTRARTERP